jgi:uncharacterized protein with HEPN domain
MEAESGLRRLPRNGRSAAPLRRPSGATSKSCRNRSRICGPTSSGIGASPSKHNPAGSLRHIMENAARVARYLLPGWINNPSPATVGRGMPSNAVSSGRVEGVCEATVGLGEQADDLMPGQPWSDIRGMVNRLRHAYDRVDVDILWRTAANRVPELAAAALQALAQLEDRRADRVSER